MTWTEKLGYVWGKFIEGFDWLAAQASKYPKVHLTVTIIAILFGVYARYRRWK